jgi:gliding motility-associated-like protein
MKEKDIGEYFKDKFAGFEQIPSDNVWKNIMQHDAVKKYNKAHFVKRAILYGTSAVVIVAVVTVLLYLTLGIDDNLSVVPNDNLSQNQVNNTESVLPDDSDNNLSFEKEAAVTTSEKQSKQQNSVVNEYNSVPLSPEKSVKTAPIVKTTVSNTPTQSRHLADIVSHSVSYSNDNSISDKKVAKSVDSQDDVNISRENPDSGQQINTNPIEPPQTDISNYNLYIPKGFTPNSDGLNDVFLVYSSYEVQNFELTIFDQSGRILFRSKDISMGWDGEAYGQKMQAGAYVYIVSYKDVTGKPHLEKGQVVLIR